MDAPSPLSRIRGSLLGAAVAEAAALAGVVDSPSAAEMPDGAPRPLGPAGQLTLFTADALTEAIEWANSGVHADEAACVWLASLRWASAQGVPMSPSAPAGQPRWLDAQDGVDVPAAVRPSWIRSLAGGEMGSPSRPLGMEFTDGGAAAHAAPYGLIPHVPASAVVRMSADGASLTHGAPVAVQAAVAVSALAHYLVLGADCRTAAESARAQIASLRSPDARVLTALDRQDGGAPELPGAEHRPDGRAADAADTLAAAVGAILAAESARESGDSPEAAFAAAVALAAAEGPDAAAIAGALLGVRWGRESVPSAWAASTAGTTAALGIADRLADVTGP
jgi:hypothetical protein